MREVNQDIGKNSMVRILCFGDSNTWGFRPDRPHTRHPRDVRWTGVLRNLLGDRFEVIEEGLNGRTTACDEPFANDNRGTISLPPCFESHQELDLVIIMLGTNDLKAHFKRPPSDISHGVEILCNSILSSGFGRNGAAPEILLVSPALVRKISLFRGLLVIPSLGGKLSLIRGLYAGAPEKSTYLAEYFQRTAQQCGCHFMDAAKVVTSSAIDGVHWDADQHDKFGTAVYEKVRLLLADR